MQPNVLFYICKNKTMTGLSSSSWAMRRCRHSRPILQNPTASVASTTYVPWGDNLIYRNCLGWLGEPGEYGPH